MEPERPIEKLLRAWAEKRRQDAGSPPDLHPATRRLLQGEVARKFGKNDRQPRSFSEGLAALWPRFVWGLGVFAVLAAVVWLVLPGNNRFRNRGNLAKNETALEAESERRSAPSPALEPASAPAGAVDRVDQPVRAENSPALPNKAALNREKRQDQREQDALSGVKGQGGDRNNAPAPGGLAGANRDGKDFIAGAGRPVASDEFRPGHEAGAPRPGFAAGPASASRPALPGGSPPAPSAPPNGSSTRTYGFSGNVTAGDTAVAPTTVSPSASPAVVTKKNGAGRESVLKEARQDADQSGSAYKSLASAAPGPAARKSQAFYADEAKKETTGAVQRFVQIEAGEKSKAAVFDKVSPASPVLAAFELQQAGQEVRIVDGDGSVYTGYTQLQDGALRLRSAYAETPARGAAGLRSAGGNLETKTPAFSDAEVQAGQNYFFRVTGTNRTLNQSVVFTGYLTNATQATVVNGVTNHLGLSGGAGGAGKSQAEPQTANQPVATTRISGKAVVGERKEVQVNAVSKASDK